MRNGCWLSLHSTANGDVVLAGTFMGTMDLGGGPLVSAGSRDIFLARLSATGDHLWSFRAGGAGDDGAIVGRDPSGRIVVGGWFSDTLSLPGTPPLNSVGGIDAYVAEIDGAGNTLWATSFGSAGNDAILAIEGHPGGQLGVAGTFEESIVIGNEALVGTGVLDGFASRIDASGTPLWSAALNTSTQVSPISVAFGDSGLIVVAGACVADIDFGTGPVPCDTALDGFVGAWDPSGTLVASRLVSGDGVQYAGVTHHDEDSFLLWGMFEKTIDLGAGPLISAGSVDVYVASWTP